MEERVGWDEYIRIIRSVYPPSPPHIFTVALKGRSVDIYYLAIAT